MNLRRNIPILHTAQARLPASSNYCTFKINFASIEIRMNTSISSFFRRSHPELKTKNSQTIRAYAGPLQLKDAIEGATIVVISGQIKAKVDTVRGVFEANADYVRNIAIHTAEFNPKTILCISTPPCACMIPMVTEEYKKARVFDPRKIIGLMNVNAVRASTLVGKATHKDPTDVVTPVIGGDCDKCIVGVFSQVKPRVELPDPPKMQETLEELQHQALFQRNNKTHVGDTELDVAHATTRFIKMLAKALKGRGECMESAFVRQTGRIGELSPYLCTPVYVGVDGIESCYLPPLTNFECDKLQAACEHMEKYIAMGENYVTGKICRECRMFPRMSDDCTIVEVAPACGYEKFAKVFEKKDPGVIEVYYGKDSARELQPTLGK